MPGEKLFENRVKKFLKEQGIWYIKYWGGANYTKTGIPDILACINGIFTAVELKAKSGKPTDLQKMNITKINQSNGIGIILYPDGFEEFKELIKGVMNCNGHIAGLNVLKDVHTNTSCVILTNY